MPAVGMSQAVLRAGSLVAGRYRVDAPLGAGGMGVVVGATDEQSGRSVAVKLLHAFADLNTVERFVREARNMGSIASEHVVSVVDSGTGDDGLPYIVMERLDGVDLATRAKAEGALPPIEAVDYVIQTCEALSHAHAKGIVHRDIKPSNLFLHRAGGRTILKVLDFGISKMQSRDAWDITLTVTDGGLLGSPLYMSPEQVRDPKNVDARSDLWSLGIVLYKLLSGNAPFEGESVGQVFALILEEPAAPLDPKVVPPGLAAVVTRCLEKDRKKRFPHVGALALALAPFASPEHAALAPAIAARMSEDGPTLEDASSQPILRDRRGEPTTLTAAGPAGAAAAIPPRAPVRPPVDETLLSGSEVALSSSFSSPSSPIPSSAGSSGRSRWLPVVAALGALGVASGISIGVAMKRGAEPSEATTATADPAAPAATPQDSASPAPSEDPPQVSAGTPSTTPSSLQAGARRPPRRGPPATASPAATSSRPADPKAKGLGSVLDTRK